MYVFDFDDFTRPKPNLLTNLTVCSKQFTKTATTQVKLSVRKIKKIMDDLDRPLPVPQLVDKDLKQNDTKDENDEIIVIEDLLTP